MRHTPVATEKMFWSLVRNRRLDGIKFKRQVLIGPYIVDFICADAGVVVELDGPAHDARAGYDSARDACLRGQGYEVLRFKNEAFPADIDLVLHTIVYAFRDRLERLCSMPGAPSP
jgi:very-short-patch-repair endonuclease